MTLRRLLLGIASIAVAATLIGGAVRADDSKNAGDHGTITVGNGFYDVSVEDSTAGLGQYTARTGDDHPVTLDTGAYQNVLYGGVGENPGTSYTTVRSFTSETDYINAYALPLSGFDVESLDDFATVETLGSTGVRTTYALPGGAESADELTIVEDVRVNGTTAENSTIEITTTVTNDGDETVDIGVRYLWDWQISDDDGPTFAPVQPDAPALLTEQTYTAPDFTAYAVADNNSESSPLFVVYGTASGPTSIEPVPTTPDDLMFASWPDSVVSAFAYATDPSLDIASYDGLVDDSAVLYYWGPDAENAITLEPGGSVTVSASLFAALPEVPPPIIDTPTPVPQPLVRHRTSTPTPTVAAATATPAPPRSVPTLSAATATPAVSGAPEISAPSTGDGSGGGGTSPVVPGLLAALVGAIALAGTAYARRTSSRRS